MTVFIIVTIVIIAIIYFVNQSNKEKRKIEAEKKQTEQIKYYDEQIKKQEETRQLEVIRHKKADENKKLDEANRLEKIRLQKIEDEKYEIFTIIIVGQNNSKYTCVLKRQNNTYAYVERPKTEFQLNSTMKLLKEKANDFEWISEDLHSIKQKEKIEIEQRNFHEANTTYSTDLHNLFIRNPQNFGLSSIRSLSTPFYNSLHEEERNQIFSELNQGVAILQTEGHLYIYMRSYGNMHQAKLLQSFESILNLSNKINGQDIQIIDYGCGQGIGSVVFIDYLKSQQANNYTISKIKLIEPSEKALRRASINSKYSLKSIKQKENVLAIHKTIDQIDLQDLSTNSQSIKFHIFSNILDVDDFCVLSLAKKISTTQNGINYFICVSPKFFEDGTHPRNIRINTFMNYFQNQNLTKISTRESNINNWTRYERIFNITV